MPEVDAPIPVATLKILLYPNGRVEINGPLHENVICYGMMEEARRIIDGIRQRRLADEAAQAKMTVADRAVHESQIAEAHAKALDIAESSALKLTLLDGGKNGKRE